MKYVFIFENNILLNKTFDRILPTDPDAENLFFHLKNDLTFDTQPDTHLPMKMLSLSLSLSSLDPDHESRQKHRPIVR